MMRVTDRDTYNGHALYKTPDTAATCGWWFVPDLHLHVKIHGRWRAEIWLRPDRLHTARLRVYDHTGGAEWLDASYRAGTPGSVPFERADQFMLKAKMPGWGEWPSEPTSSGRVPMAQCRYCHGPVSHTELLVIDPRPDLSRVYPELKPWAPRTHRSCHQDHRRRQAFCDTTDTGSATAPKAG